MAQVKRGDAHGLSKVQVALVGTNGYAYGQVGPTMGQGVTSGAYLIDTPKSCTMPTPDRNTINFTGGNVWQGAFQYGIDQVGSFDLTISGYDADLIALVTGGAVDQTTNQRWTYFSENELKEILPQVCILITYRLQARGGATDGAAVFITTIIPRAWMGPKGISGAPSFQAAGEYTFTITPTSSTVLPHSLALSGTAMDLENDKAFRIHAISDNPLGLCSHIGDSGGSASFTLPYLPVSSTVTLNNTANELCIGGTLTAANGVSTTTGVVTEAIAEDAFAGILYETNFVPVS